MNSKDSKQIEKVIILGTGPAGLSASLYAARADLTPLIFTGTQIGGQAALTDRIENYADRFGTRIEYDTATEVDLSTRPFLVKTYSNSFRTQILIIATGANPNKLNIPGENEFLGKGVSYCATCDGWFFKDKTVVVVGGGDSALEEGIFLTRYASSVKIIHRRDELRAGAILQKRAFNNTKIEFIWDSVVKEVKGSDAVEKIELENVKTGKRNELSTDGFFVFIGHKPTTDLFKSQLELDEKGYIVVDKRMRTNIHGVFAAGEVCDPLYRQVITSAGMGAAAAIETTRLLESESE